MARQSAFAGQGIYNTPVLQPKSNLISREWAKQFQQATVQLISPVSANVPATSASPGTFGMLATDGTWLYVCIGNASWKRIALTAF